MTTWEQRRPFIEALRDDAAVTSSLSEERLAACFDLKRALSNVGRIFDALDAAHN
jgi:adenylosuccinate lyase